jgi:hypothetical protein
MEIVEEPNETGGCQAVAKKEKEIGPLARHGLEQSAQDNDPGGRRAFSSMMFTPGSSGSNGEMSLPG